MYTVSAMSSVDIKFVESELDKFCFMLLCLFTLDVYFWKSDRTYKIHSNLYTVNWDILDVVIFWLIWQLA